MNIRHDTPASARPGTTRRHFLRNGILGVLGTTAVWPLVGRQRQPLAPDNRFCVAVCDHWSYTGIGWELGMESDVLSLKDAMELADRPPHVKTCINFDARAFEMLDRNFPEICRRLKRYLAEGKVELIGGTYGQPMGTTIGNESNIRQFILGREAIRQTLGYNMVTFLEEEEFSHPQVPQILAAAGFRYASLAQADTWGRAGAPVLPYNVIGWKGIDGTTIPCVPKNPLYGHSLDLNELLPSEEFKRLQETGIPLVLLWEEFGWEDLEHPAYVNAAAPFQALAEKHPVQFVTLRDYLDQYGASAKEICLPMEAWSKSLTWGLGGDQIRILDRKVEGLLLAAELFDALAPGGVASQADLLVRAWKDLLASQSHDIGLCEYVKFASDHMPPLERIEDKHNFTWGELGYELLDSARFQGQAVLDSSLKALASRVNSREREHGSLAANVFNPLDYDRTGLAFTGRLYPIPENIRSIHVKNREGQPVPSQLVHAERDRDGNLVVAEIAFIASNVPSIGYDTYYIEFTGDSRAGQSGIIIDEEKFLMENEHLRIRLDPTHGAVSSLILKAAGREMIDGSRGAFPRFTGRPCSQLSLRPSPPDAYDSAGSRGRLDLIARGPVFATWRARHHWKYMTYETRITLAMGLPYVEVLSRVFAQVPPAASPAGNAQPPLLNTESGYWLSFTPAFEVSRVQCDYPLAVETTQKKGFHALTFADLLGPDRALLVLHSGTQWFTRDDRGSMANLIMREWESTFTGEFGWPVYSEYRHALLPHGPDDLTNAARLRHAAGFTRPLLCHVGPLQTGQLPLSKSFIGVTPDTLLVSAVCKTSDGIELRVLENDGRSCSGVVQLDLPIKNAIAIDLLGRRTGDVTLSKRRLSFSIEPWKFHTFRVS